MKNILIVDMQVGYLNEDDNKIVKNLNNYLKNNQFGTVLYTKFITNHNGTSFKNIHWFGIYDKLDRKLAVRKLQQGKVFEKKCHGLTPLIINYLIDEKVKEIEICGVNNDNNFELILAQLNQLNIKPIILDDYIINNESCCTDIEITNDSIYKTLNGFYIGDMFSNDHKEYTDETILSFALIEWLLHTKKTTQEFQTILAYYYKLYPNKNHIYDDKFALWLENGCRNYRICEDFDGAKYSTPIGFYSKTISEIDELIEKCLIVTHNSSEAKISAKIICYSIFLLRINTYKKDLLSKINAIFNLNIEENLENNINLYKNDKNAINMAKIVLSIFVTSKTFTDAIKIATEVKQDGAILCTTCALCEAYYKDIPADIIIDCRNNLPDKFKNLLMEFSKVKNEKIY